MPFFLKPLVKSVLARWPPARGPGAGTTAQLELCVSPSEPPDTWVPGWPFQSHLTSKTENEKGSCAHGKGWVQRVWKDVADLGELAKDIPRPKPIAADQPRGLERVTSSAQVSMSSHMMEMVASTSRTYRTDQMKASLRKRTLHRDGPRNVGSDYGDSGEGCSPDQHRRSAQDIAHFHVPWRWRFWAPWGSAPPASEQAPLRAWSSLSASPLAPVSPAGERVPPSCSSMCSRTSTRTPLRRSPPPHAHREQTGHLLTGVGKPARLRSRRLGLCVPSTPRQGRPTRVAHGLP